MPVKPLGSQPQELEIWSVLRSGTSSIQRVARARDESVIGGWAARVADPNRVAVRARRWRVPRERGGARVSLRDRPAAAGRLDPELIARVWTSGCGRAESHCPARGLW